MRCVNQNSGNAIGKGPSDPFAAGMGHGQPGISVKIQPVEWMAGQIFLSAMQTFTHAEPDQISKSKNTLARKCLCANYILQERVRDKVFFSILSKNSLCARDKRKKYGNCSARFSKYHSCKTDAQAPGYLPVTQSYSGASCPVRKRQKLPATGRISFFITMSGFCTLPLWRLRQFAASFAQACEALIRNDCNVTCK
ncbi:hypothetical protein LZ24_00754 [Desulfobotulus alkaliphilus]|uniref:Uncharacterized protein n=1 Tax=Desulfobotulus alkaliphilus TaxID=622671 RepID=A0A562S2J9_9BACT|nr:hypothetical protein LZ24_00754 [Desulfobotulus alkaliphilus]